jgi:hypothetical protein
MKDYANLRIIEFYLKFDSGGIDQTELPLVDTDFDRRI